MKLIKKKSENEYIISKSRLESLLQSEHELNALEYGGVDNWMNYSDAFNYYLDEEAQEAGIEDEDFDFEQLVELDLLQIDSLSN